MNKCTNSTFRIAGLYLLLIFGVTDATAQKDKVLDNIDLVFHNTADMLQQIHYAPKQLDDQFASQIFTSYLQQLDPGKRFFMQADINRFKKYEKELDDEMRGKTVQFYKMVNTVFKQRIHDADQLVAELLKQPFHFAQAETYNTNVDALDWCTSADALKTRWKKHLKYQVLVQYEDLLELSVNDSTATSAHNANGVAKHATALEEKARQAVLRTEKRYMDNLQKLTTDEEAFNTYLNSIVNLYDPHSNYFLPVDRRAFQENLSGIYYGIGAVLQEQHGKVQIGELMIGGPAWKSGQVEKGDVIVKVAQQGEKGVEVAGMPMSEVIKMTRGQKESTVIITFKKQDGRLQDVTMKREPLQLEETFVKSAVIEDSVRIGYISFPRFYTDFGDPNGRSCARDMAKELARLKKENVEGVIIDIRNNGGGSLGEVISMIGLFINGGPVVQVKNPSGNPYVANASGKDMIYDGPLIVLVNEMSASASEIFAAAIQDYKRGIIVGSRSTYGKGSVQRSFGIADPRMTNKQTIDLGTLNITLQKYYRITGEATQLKGITPDILLPGIYEPYNMQEKSNPSALGWDKIPPIPFTPWNNAQPSFANILDMARKRIQQDTTLNALQGNLDWLRNRGEQYSLQLPVYQQEQKELQQKVGQIRKELTGGRSMNIKNNADVEDDLKKREQFRIESNKAWLNSLQKDIYLSEAVFVIRDFLKLKNS
jgi:carboxyl-terminal processing protease